MATATRSPLVEQAEKIDRLARHLSNGHLLEKPVRLAGSDTVWTGPIRDGFMGWIAHALDFWVRNQLAEGLRLVARALFDRAAAVEQAAAQMLATGQVTVAPPAVPTPLNYTPGTPPAYGDIGGGANNTFNVPEMRNLSHLLLATADEVMNFARTVDQALRPPPAPPPPPGTPPPINPLPPDAEAVVGYPQAYLETANQLRSAAMDVAKRADIVQANEEPLATTPIDLGIVDAAASGAAAQVTSSDPAADAAQQPEEKPPPTEDEMRIAREEGEKLAARALDEKALEDPQELNEIAKELEAHKNDPAAEAYAAAFVKKFGPKNMLAIPRAVHSFQTGVSREPQTDWERATKPPPPATTEEKEEILYAFSATLATATQSDDLDQKVEDKLLATEDKLALAWLLANPNADFAADFLVKAFEVGVKDQLFDEAAMTGLGVYGGKTAGPLELTGTKLDTDPKVHVLEAISRNKEAAMRIADMEFKPPLNVPMGLRPPAAVHNVTELLYLAGATPTGYSDKGAALGRMLDTAHRGFCETGDAGNAKELVDQILRGATSDKDVAAAQGSLRLIGLRQPLAEGDSERALATVRDEPKHPGREALLGMASQVEATAAKFVGDAISAAGKAKVNPNKDPDLRELYQTDAAWDGVLKLATSSDPRARNDAETVTEQTITKVAGGADLNDAARRGLARAISSNVGAFASSISEFKQPSIQRGPDMGPSLEAVHVTMDEFVAALADLMKDRQARTTLQAGAGSLAAAWASDASNEYLNQLSGKNVGPASMFTMDDQRSKHLGEYLCSMVHGASNAATDKAQAAVDALWGMRLGIDLAFMGVDLAKSFLPGAGVVTKVGEFAIGQAADAIQGGAGVEGMPDLAQGGVKGFLDREVEAKENSAWAQAKVEVKDAHVQSHELVVDTLTGSMLQEAIRRPPEECDRLLDQLGIRAIGPDGNELRGLDALRDAKLLGDDGRIHIPRPGTPDHTRYRDWARLEAKDFDGKISGLALPVETHFNGCITSAIHGDSVKG